LCPRPHRAEALIYVCLSVCLSRTSGLTRDQRGLGRLKLAQMYSPRHMWLGHHFQGQKVKGQLVADVLNSQHAVTGATWRINAKILSTCRGRRHIVSPRAQLVIAAVWSHTVVYSHRLAVKIRRRDNCEVHEMQFHSVIRVALSYSVESIPPPRLLMSKNCYSYTNAVHLISCRAEYGGSPVHLTVMIMSYLYSASLQKNNASNAHDVPSTVQKETSSVCDKNSQFVCPALVASCFGTSSMSSVRNPNPSPTPT